MRKKRAPSKYNLFIKKYIAEHRGDSDDIRELFTDATAAWNRGADRRDGARRGAATRAYKRATPARERERIEQKKQTAKVHDLLTKIKAQLEEAKTTDKDEMTSALIHEKEQVFEIEELKMRLQERQKKVEVQCDEESLRERKIAQSIVNQQDDLTELDKELEVEQGPLMQQVMKARILRCIGLNPSNTAGNEVTGTATGGESVARREERSDEALRILCQLATLVANTVCRRYRVHSRSRNEQRQPL